MSLKFDRMSLAQRNTGILNVFVVYAKVHIRFVDNLYKLNCLVIHFIRGVVLYLIVLTCIESTGCFIIKATKL